MHPRRVLKEKVKEEECINSFHDYHEAHKAVLNSKMNEPPQNVSKVHLPK